ncbi:toxic anion resistance protein [Nostocoides vanveenii]|uniref:Toxic anion resistance protein n=2 Tax=Nostocoides vanveenii TaxID=330835 RepID=A0ABN2KC84_9MICO
MRFSAPRQIRTAYVRPQGARQKERRRMSDQPAIQDAVQPAIQDAVQPLAPPNATLTLDAPPAMQTVPSTAAPAMAPAVPAAAVPMLDQKVDGFLSALMTAETKSPAYEAKASEMRTMGDDDIRRAAESSNRLLQSPVKALQEGGLSQGSKVGKTLLELRRTVEELDPSQAQGAKKVLGMIPFGDRITDYFRKYQSAQSHLNGILHSLRNGQDELQRDNVALNLEKQQLWDSMGRLNQYVYIAERLDAKLAAQIATLDTSDPAKAKALREDVLFYVRQKHQDLLTQLAVSIQNYLAIDIVIKNNIELIKGVDRATTTTISALRTAVIVAQALGNQQLVLDQITALNTTTSGLIERTSEMLKDNSIRIQEQAASATIGLPQLQRAFQNIYATMDAIDTFKVQALDNMAATIGTLEGEVAKSRSYLDRVQRADTRIAQGSLDLGSPTQN